MKKILIINGPNLNMLGKRDPNQYGNKTLSEINEMLRAKAREIGVALEFFQSNHEGELIDFMQKNYEEACGIIINPGALTHYGYSLRDALEQTKLPIVEVHLSDVKNRETFRSVDVLFDIIIAEVRGLKEQSYLKGLDTLLAHLKLL